MDDDDDFPFDLSEMMSSSRPKVETLDSDSDDDFKLPTTPRVGALADTAAAAAAAAAAVVTPSSLPATPMALVKGEDARSISSSDAASAKKDAADDPQGFDNKDLGAPTWWEVAAQKELRWDSIAKEDLVWYGSYPALVVPARMHKFVPTDVAIPRADEVMAYGPNQSSEQLAAGKKRYVILHYLPLCHADYEKPTCGYSKVGGMRTEIVYPYNTLLDQKVKGEKPALGPEDRWADMDFHERNIKKKRAGKKLTPELWNVAMAWAQSYLSHALELENEDILKRKLTAEEAAEEAAFFAQEDTRRKEASERPESEDEGSMVTVRMTKNLCLAAGDKIFFWDKTKIAQTADARKVATILEIRTPEEVEEGKLRLGLSNNQIVLDDWVIQKFVRDKKTGEFTGEIDPRGNRVRSHRCTPGKFEDGNGWRDRLMGALTKKMQEAVTAFGAGDQMRELKKRKREDSDAVDDVSAPVAQDTARTSALASLERGGQEDDEEESVAKYAKGQLAASRRGEGDESPQSGARGDGKSSSMTSAATKSEDDEPERGPSTKKAKVKSEKKCAKDKEGGNGRNSNEGTPHKGKSSSSKIKEAKATKATTKPDDEKRKAMAKAKAREENFAVAKPEAKGGEQGGGGGCGGAATAASKAAPRLQKIVACEEGTAAVAKERDEGGESSKKREKSKKGEDDKNVDVKPLQAGARGDGKSSGMTSAATKSVDDEPERGPSTKKAKGKSEKKFAKDKEGGKGGNPMEGTPGKGKASSSKIKEAKATKATTKPDNEKRKAMAKAKAKAKAREENFAVAKPEAKGGEQGGGGGCGGAATAASKAAPWLQQIVACEEGTAAVAKERDEGGESSKKEKREKGEKGEDDKNADVKPLQAAVAKVTPSAKGGSGGFVIPRKKTQQGEKGGNDKSGATAKSDRPVATSRPVHIGETTKASEHPRKRQREEEGWTVVGKKPGRRSSSSSGHKQRETTASSSSRDGNAGCGGNREQPGTGREWSAASKPRDFRDDPACEGRPPAAIRAGIDKGSNERLKWVPRAGDERKEREDGWRKRRDEGSGVPSKGRKLSKFKQPRLSSGKKGMSSC